MCAISVVGALLIAIRNGNNKVGRPSRKWGDDIADGSWCTASLQELNYRA